MTLNALKRKIGSKIHIESRAGIGGEALGYCGKGDSE